jgi:hypothetical protein
MTLPIWPTELPRPTVDGYSRSRGTTRRTSAGNDTIKRVSRGWSISAQRRPMSMMIETDLLMRFERFFDEDLADGTYPFAMPDWEIDGTPLEDETGAVLTDETGDPLLIAATHIVRFGDGDTPYSVSPIGMAWRVSLDLVILP